jgi:hypothetical protein
MNMPKEAVLTGAMTFGGPGCPVQGFIWKGLGVVWDIYKIITEIRTRNKSRDETLQQLFRLSGITQVWPGRDHPLAPTGGAPHLDNVVAVEALRGFFQKDLKQDDDRADVDPSINLICVGGTADNPMLAEALEYEWTEDGPIRSKQPLIKLPIEEQPLESREKVWRMVAGKRYQVLNYWFQSPHCPLTPYVVDGELQNDYLVITRIPNLLSLSGFINGAEMLMIQGGHGVGTQAFSLVVNNLSLEDLKKINAEREGHPYYQTYFKIPKLEIRNDWQLPTGVEYLYGSTFPIEVDRYRVLEQFRKRQSTHPIVKTLESESGSETDGRSETH